jgi:anti-sigma-K factor RskA
VSKEEYITSGLLELYAAGGLTSEEREEVEYMASESPEIRLALEEACAAMEFYAQQYAVTPKNDVKARILNSIQNQTIASSSNHNQISDSEFSNEPDPVVRPLYPSEPKSDFSYKMMFAASVGLFLITGFLSYFFYNRWQQAEQQLALVNASEQLLAQNVQTVSLKSRQLEEALDVLRNPDFKSTILNGVAAQSESKMVVYWNPGQQQVYVDRIQLPSPPAGMQYQLWALDNGKPIDAGMLTLQEGSGYLQQMKSISSAQAFAVTLEPIGGSSQPNLDQLMVMGEINA